MKALILSDKTPDGLVAQLGALTFEPAHVCYAIDGKGRHYALVLHELERARPSNIAAAADRFVSDALEAGEGR